jgi:hypothetical protein
MVPHYSGTTLDAQKRYADGTKAIMEAFFKGEPIDQANVIVEKGKVSRRLRGTEAVVRQMLTSLVGPRPPSSPLRIPRRT